MMKRTEKAAKFNLAAALLTVVAVAVAAIGFFFLLPTDLLFSLLTSSWDHADEEMEVTGAKRLAADKRKDSKKDSEDEEEKVKADSAEKHSKEIEELKRTIAGLSQLVRQPIPEMDRAALAGIQSRADSVMIQLGERAQQPLVGESPAAYRRRMAQSLQKHSARWKKTKLDSIDEDTFQEVEGQIYADALERAKSPNDIGPGRMREVTRHDPSGHIVTEFFGSEASIVQQFSRPTRRARVRDMGGVSFNRQ